MVDIAKDSSEEIQKQIASQQPYVPFGLTFDTRKPGVSGGRFWQLILELYPEPKITFTGDSPMTKEIVNVLGRLSAPCWMVDVIKVLVLVAQKQEIASND